MLLVPARVLAMAMAMTPSVLDRYADPYPSQRMTGFPPFETATYSHRVGRNAILPVSFLLMASGAGEATCGVTDVRPEQATAADSAAQAIKGARSDTRIERCPHLYELYRILWNVTAWLGDATRSRRDTWRFYDENGTGTLQQ